MVEYAKTDTVSEWTVDLAFRVIHAAEFYALRDLAFQAEAFLFEHTTRATAASTLRELDEYHAPTLRVVCLYWVLHHHRPRDAEEGELQRWWGL